MSDYCSECSYSVKEKTGKDACPFNLLYWHFLSRHRSRFSDNPRMAMMYRTWDKMDSDRQDEILTGAADFLSRLDAGDPV